MRIYFIFLSILTILACLNINRATSKEIYINNESGKIKVKIAYRKGRPSVLRFFDKVKHIVGAEKFIIKPTGNHSGNSDVLSITPKLKSGRFNVVFLLKSGTAIDTEIIVLRRTKRDQTALFYDFKSKKHTKKNENINFRPPELDLMLAMINGKHLQNYKVSKENFIFDKDSIVKRFLVKSYIGGQFCGYIFKIKNGHSKITYDVDITTIRLRYPNKLLMAYIENSLINPRKYQYLYLVSKSQIEKENFKLPFQNKDIKNAK